MKDSGIEIINIFQNKDDDKKREIVTQKMQKIINSQINSNNTNKIFTSPPKRNSSNISWFNLINMV